MKFKDFLQNVVNTAETPLDLKFGPAIVWHNVDNIPVRVRSLGCSHGSVIKLPSLVTACSGKVVPVLAFTDGIFIDKTDITDVILPNKFCSITKGAFSGCTNLKRITIPRTVNLIYKNAFYNCDSLEDVYYEGAKEDWEQIISTLKRRVAKEPRKLGLYCEMETRIVPGNEALFKAKIHFNCYVPDNEPMQLVRENTGTCIFAYKQFVKNSK